MKTSQTQTEILKATIYFGKAGSLMPIVKAGSLMPIVFEDCHWQTAAMDGAFPVLDHGGNPIRDPLSDAGFDDQTGADLRPFLTLGDLDVERWNRIWASSYVRLLKIGAAFGLTAASPKTSVSDAASRLLNTKSNKLASTRWSTMAHCSAFLK